MKITSKIIVLDFHNIHERPSKGFFNFFISRLKKQIQIIVFVVNNCAVFVQKASVSNDSAIIRKGADILGLIIVKNIIVQFGFITVKFKF